MLVFVHVPKTGGLNFHHTVKQSLGRAMLSVSTALPSEQYLLSNAQIEELLRFHPGTLLLDLGHNANALAIPDRLGGEKAICLSFVRRPVERFLSHYFFCRNETRRFSQAAQEMPLEQYVRHCIGGGLRSEMDTVHTRYVDSQACFLGRSDDAVAARDRLAGRIEKKTTLLFPLERYDEACVVLEAMFPRQCPDLSYAGRRNASERSAPSPRVLELLSQWLQDDRETWALGNACLDAAVSEVTAQGASLEDRLLEFRMRCERLRSENKAVGR